MRFVLVLLILTAASPVYAQDPPPKIGPYVIDFHVTVPRFPADDPNLAASRGMQLGELPGVGIGLQLGAHVYPLRWKVITFGIGGEVASTRASQTPLDTTTGLRSSTETFQTLDGDLSFNFGTGNGWSYISGGLGQSIRSLVPAGQDPLPADSEHLRTVHYGVGARWFAKKHLAFSFDIRWYQMDPGSPELGYNGANGTPRTTLMIMGAGISVR